MTHRRNPAVYGCLLTLIAAVMLVIAPVAHAQPPGIPLDGKTMGECVSRETDKAAAKQMVKENSVKKPEGWRGLFTSREQVEDVKKQNPQRFEELKKQYNEDDGARNRVGGAGNVIACGLNNPVDRVGKVVSEKKSEFWDDPIGKFVHAAVEGNTEALKTAMTFWTKFKIDGGKTTDQATGVRNIVWSVAGIAFILSVIVTGVRMAASRRQGLADGMEDFGKFYGTYLVVGVMVPLIIPLALAGTDWLTDQILTGLPDGKKFTDLMGVNQLGDEISGPMLMGFLVIFAFLGSLTQMVALVARVLFLPIVVGFLPVAAAASAGQTGRASMNSMLSWTFTAIAFKPIAAIVYVTAFWVVNDDTITGPGGVEGEAGLRIIKVLLLGMAGFSPLLVLKVISPVFASAGGQNSGAVAGMAGGAIGLGGAVLGGAATALGAGSRGLSAASRAVGGGKASGGSGGSSGSGRVLGGSPSGPSGGSPGGPGGSPSGGAPRGGGPTGGSPGGAPGAQPGSDGASGIGGAPASAAGGGGQTPGSGGSQMGGAGVATSPGSDPRGGNTATGAGQTFRAQGGGGNVARRVGAGALRASAAALGATAGGARIAARAAAHTGNFTKQAGSLSGVFEDAGGTIRK